MKKIKWAVIGAGGIADRRTIPGILEDAGSELAAVMDKNAEIAKAAGEKYGVPHFSDEEEMLKNVECDAVYIATPVFCHYDQAMLCLKYGKHVLCEKPLTLKTEEAKKLLEAFKASGKHFSVGYMMKFHNLHEKARKLVKEGAIGQVADVRAMFSCWYPDIPGAWRQTKALGGGGSFMDLGVHCAELIEYVLGEKITEVKSFINTRTFKYEVEDSAVVIFKTESGILGHIDCNFNVDLGTSPSRLELYGTAGHIICDGTLHQIEEGTLSYAYAPQEGYEAMQNNKDADKTAVYKGEGSNLYTKQIQSFCEHVRSGKPNYDFAETAVHIGELCDMIYADAEK